MTNKKGPAPRGAAAHLDLHGAAVLAEGVGALGLLLILGQHHLALVHEDELVHIVELAHDLLGLIRSHLHAVDIAADEGPVGARHFGSGNKLIGQDGQQALALGAGLGIVRGGIVRSGVVLHLLLIVSSVVARVGGIAAGHQSKCHHHRQQQSQQFLEFHVHSSSIIVVSLDIYINRLCGLYRSLHHTLVVMLSPSTVKAAGLE